VVRRGALKVESLMCNNCGAPISVPESARYVTCGHCGSQLVIRRTESAHFTEVLQRLDERTEQMSESLEAIQLQNELERIDREWQIEREKYRIEGRNGTSTLPSGGSALVAVIAGVVAVLFGVVWTNMASSMGAPGWFPFFGLIFILAAFVGVASNVMKASRYSRAEQTYLRRREEVLRRLKESQEYTPPG
jgi:DNA-directed RNA polymerase subunit RPC12/RpoP